VALLAPRNAESHHRTQKVMRKGAANVENKNNRITSEVRQQGPRRVWARRSGQLELNASRQALRNTDTMGKSVWKIEEKEATYDSPNHFTPLDRATVAGMKTPQMWRAGRTSRCYC
jgi:hypothetical protein